MQERRAFYDKLHYLFRGLYLRIRVSMQEHRVFYDKLHFVVGGSYLTRSICKNVINFMIKCIFLWEVLYLTRVNTQ